MDIFKRPINLNKESTLATYKLFISHSWEYSDAYTKMIGMLDTQKNSSSSFSYHNHSVPKDDPIQNAPSDKALRAAIEAQMKGCSSVLILAGVYASYSKWINIEIEIAQKLGKRIIAIEPWGSEKTSAVVKNAAHAIVKWNGASIVQAIEAA